MAELTKREAWEFWHRQYQAGNLVIWCVTSSPKDFPGHYVARPIVVPNQKAREEDGYLIARTLDELRRLLPDRLTRMDRNPQDDPVIIETWF